MQQQYEDWLCARVHPPCGHTGQGPVHGVPVCISVQTFGINNMIDRNAQSQRNSESASASTGYRAATACACRTKYSQKCRQCRWPMPPLPRSPTSPWHRRSPKKLPHLPTVHLPTQLPVQGQPPPGLLPVPEWREDPDHGSREQG